MIPKKLMIMFALGLTLIASPCWADPVFREVLSNLEMHADIAKKRAQKIETLADRIRTLANEIENLSDTIVAKKQRPRIRILENKIDVFQERVEELEELTDGMRLLAGKMQKESNRVKGRP
ncbi:MAG: hypothetical protein SV775_05555 [Thermodesulfobacteriota bacterium]|nr:hypothetical protein [Thermodesulfobacteriota bacterium]